MRAKLAGRSDRFVEDSESAEPLTGRPVEREAAFSSPVASGAPRRSSGADGSVARNLSVAAPSMDREAGPVFVAPAQ